MRIIAEGTIKDWAVQYPDAAAWLRNWVKFVRGAHWTSLRVVRLAYPHADGVEVDSGRIATVFNVSGNKYRLIVKVNYPAQVVFICFLGTHAEYDKVDAATIWEVES